MAQHTPLIATIVASLGLAFVLGTLANRLRLPPLAGYLLAGVLVGPFTPGFVADQPLALELAEIGVILLMFGVGLHFSLDDLLSVRAIAVPGAVVQIAAATLLGMGLAWAMGWPPGAGLIFGLALSVASTVVLLRALEERRLVQTDRGRIAVGWLIVEDLAMVLALVILPAAAGLLGGAEGAAGGAGGLAGALGLTLLRVAAFVAFMLVVGRRVIPWMLHYIVHTGSRELFSLCVLAIALGVAFGSAALFGVSFALGAFFAGMVMAGSTLTQRAAEETLPLRDAFSVLFFVSVGMLFDPMVLVRQPLQVLATFLIIVLGKSAAAFLIVRAFGRPAGTALLISASLAQIGEFSFILAGLGIELGLMLAQGRNLILAGAILSILFNPVAFWLVDRHWQRERSAEADAAGAPALVELQPTGQTDHAVVAGYGRVGAIVGAGLVQAGVPVLVIEDRNEQAAALRGAGVEVLFASAAEPRALQAANLAQARWLVVAIPNAFVAQRVVAQARALNPRLVIVARARFDDEVEPLHAHGADRVVLSEQEVARAMLERVLGSPGRRA